MANIVNLDALIPREDFEVEETLGQSQASQTIQIRDLEKDSFFYKVLKKPDFQRETNEWNTNKIADFIKSFLDGDLIPAIILWQAGSNVFVIDGAHRISALISWVLDDYGDGPISKMFFDSVIPNAQNENAEKTRRYIKKNIGSYEDFKFAIQHPDRSDKKIVEQAKRLGSLALQLQWVTGNSDKAEASFFKINQQAAPIDKTELRLLQSRKKPSAIAARSIIRAGTGHKYWSSFDAETQLTIEKEAKEINNLLFMPELRTPIKTLDLPIAGKGYSSLTLPLVVDFVNIANNIKNESTTTKDLDGKMTIDFLKKCKRLLNRVTGVHASSLGLHPVIYFYSQAGRYQPTAFFAILELVKKMEEENSFNKFIKIREKFENFLLKYKILPIQVVYRYGSGTKGYLALTTLFAYIIDKLEIGEDNEKIIKGLEKSEDFSYLQPKEVDETETKSTTFNTETKSATFLRDALQSPLKCPICKGLIHYNSISIDHIIRKEDGGLGTIQNAQLTHPYCNTTFKN